MPLPDLWDVRVITSAGELKGAGGTHTHTLVGRADTLASRPTNRPAKRSVPSEHRLSCSGQTLTGHCSVRQSSERVRHHGVASSSSPSLMDGIPGCPGASFDSPEMRARLVQEGRGGGERHAFPPPYKRLAANENGKPTSSRRREASSGEGGRGRPHGRACSRGGVERWPRAHADLEASIFMSSLTATLR